MRLHCQPQYVGPDFLGFLVKPISFEHESTRIGEESPPLLCKIYTPARATEKIETELSLHLTYTRRQGWLGDVERFCRPCEGGDLSDFQKRSKRRCLEVQRRVLLVTPYGAHL